MNLEEEKAFVETPEGSEFDNWRGCVFLLLETTVLKQSTCSLAKIGPRCKL